MLIFSAVELILPQLKFGAGWYASGCLFKDIPPLDKNDEQNIPCNKRIFSI
jgi:hypothetical protein